MSKVCRRAGLWLAALAVAGMVPGCGAFRSHRREMERLHASGDYQGAATLLDEEEDDLYRREQLLWHLDRGAVALATNDDDLAIEHLNEAERLIDLKREKTPDELIAVWLVSERAAPYLVEPFEDIYVNVLKILAQLEAGRIEGGATVEARRLAWKADHLRDVHAVWSDALDRQTRSTVGRSVHGTVGTSREGEYIESPLGTYLAAIAFMEAGESQMQAVAARRLQRTIDYEAGLIGPVRAEPFLELETMAADEADLLVVALSGRAPTKEAVTVGPIIIYTVPIYFELPRMKRNDTTVADVAVEVEGVGEYDLHLIEDMASVAVQNHERHLPLIEARTILRASAKAIGTAVAAGAASNSDNGLAALAIVLGGLAYMLVTEKADLRSWVFLPGQAHVATFDLSPGSYRIRTIYKDAGGSTLYSTGWRQVTIEDRGLHTQVEHYWR